MYWLAQGRHMNAPRTSDHVLTFATPLRVGGEQNLPGRDRRDVPAMGSPPTASSHRARIAKSDVADTSPTPARAPCPGTSTSQLSRLRSEKQPPSRGVLIWSVGRSYILMPASHAWCRLGRCARSRGWFCGVSRGLRRAMVLLHRVLGGGGAAPSGSRLRALLQR